MNEEIRNAAERFADEHQQEQRELLYALGRLPAPTRQEDLRAAFCRDWGLVSRCLSRGRTQGTFSSPATVFAMSQDWS